MPTVSVMVGPVALATHLILQWAETLVRPVVLVRLQQPELQAVVAVWVDDLARRLDLRAAAIDWLARRMDRTTWSLERSLGLMTPHEVGMFLESVLPRGFGTGVERVGRRLIEYAAAGIGLQGSGLAPDLDLLLEGFGRPWVRLFTAMGDLISLEFLPILVLSPTDQNVDVLEKTARLSAELAVAQPGVALALPVEQRLFDFYVARAPASRAKSLLRESVITVPCPELGAITDSRLTPIESPKYTSSDLIVTDLKPGTLDSQSEKPESNDDQARSAAERFLFESLESVAETAGLFELNATLNFHFGLNRWIEVDLLARSLKLAVEVDGYHHFQDPEAFRRDRRKDLELQKHGYLIVRVLADDVVRRFEEVMNTIVAAVAFRHVEAIALKARS